MEKSPITPKMNGVRVKNTITSGKKKSGAPRENFNEILDGVILNSTPPNRNSNKNKKSPEVRQDLVNKYRLDLKKGIYDIKALEIADKIIQKIRDDRT